MVFRINIFSRKGFQFCLFYAGKARMRGAKQMKSGALTVFRKFPTKLLEILVVEISKQYRLTEVTISKCNSQFRLHPLKHNR